MEIQMLIQPFCGNFVSFVFAIVALGFPSGDFKQYFEVCLAVTFIQTVLVFFMTSVPFYSDSNKCWDRIGYPLYTVLIFICAAILPLVLVVNHFALMGATSAGA